MQIANVGHLFRKCFLTVNTSLVLPPAFRLCTHPRNSEGRIRVFNWESLWGHPSRIYSHIIQVLLVTRCGESKLQNSGNIIITMLRGILFSFVDRGSLHPHREYTCRWFPGIDLPELISKPEGEE